MPESKQGRWRTLLHICANLCSARESGRQSIYLDVCKRVVEYGRILHFARKRATRRPGLVPVHAYGPGCEYPLRQASIGQNLHTGRVLSLQSHGPLSVAVQFSPLEPAVHLSSACSFQMLQPQSTADTNGNGHTLPSRSNQHGLEDHLCSGSGGLGHSGGICTVDPNGHPPGEAGIVAHHNHPRSRGHRRS